MSVPPDTIASTDPDTFARTFLNSIQAQSFAEQREFCGYFLRGPDGRIAATAPVRGTRASCDMPAPGTAVFASYHTHGTFDFDYDNEVPSPQDLLSDFEFRIDGYISTPGGRVWRVSNAQRIALQICGLGCVAVDPRFRPRQESLINSNYTISQLNAR